MDDQRIPYGARCTWWDSIDKVGSLPTPPMNLTRGDGSQTKIEAHSLPCCPICKGVLFEFPTLEEWQKNVTAYAEKVGDPEYPEFISWLRGRCFPDYAKARYCFNNRGVFDPDIGKGPFAGTMTRNMGTGRFG